MDTYGLLNNNTGLLTGLSEGIRGGLEAFRTERDRKDKLRHQMVEEQRQQGLLDAQLSDRQNHLSDEMKLAAFKASLKPAGGRGAQKPSIAQNAVDKAYAKSYEEDVLSGGNATAERNIGEVESALSDLKGKKVTTGGLLSILPDFARDYIDPSAKANQDKIRQAVMSSLKATLGAQFTEREGQKIFDLAYNPRQGTEENARRVGDLLTQIKSGYGAKKAAQDYYEKNGTMTGYKGPKVDMNAISAAVEPKGLMQSAASEQPKTMVLPNGMKVQFNPQTGKYSPMKASAR